MDQTTGGGFEFAYHSNVTDAGGIFVRQVAPSLGAPQRAPNVLTRGKSFLAPDHRVPLVARAGGWGWFPRHLRRLSALRAHVRLWRVGGRSSRRSPPARTSRTSTSLGAGEPLWVMWQDSGRLRATRTNKAGGKGRRDRHRAVATGHELAVGRLRRRARSGRSICSRTYPRAAASRRGIGRCCPD